MSREKVRLLHTSDVHLDNRINGRDDESAAQVGLRRVVDRSGLVGDGVHFSRTALSENIAACSCLAPPGEYDEIGGQRKRKKEKKEKKEKKKEKKGKKGKVPPPPPEEEPLAPKPKPKPKPTMSYSEMLSAAPRMAWSMPV